MEDNSEMQKMISEISNKYNIPEETLKTGVEMLSELVSEFLHSLSTNVKLRQLISSLHQDS